MAKNVEELNRLSHTTWNCKYHIVFAPKYRSREFWCRGYYVDTVGKNTKKIEEYIKNQLKEDQIAEQLEIEYGDPFKANR